MSGEPSSPRPCVNVRTWRKCWRSTHRLVERLEKKDFGTNMHKTDDAFWVVFDTSQYPAYYRDVHDLIAAPRRFVLRYQYREDLLSDSARTLALKQKSLPVLLLYIQKNAIYARQANKSIPADENEKNLIVLTRLC